MADNLQATPRNELLGLLSDAMYGGINYMKDPRRSQQMQGLAGLLESTGIPQTTQRMAYGEPLTNIGRANVPLLKPETADAMMNVAPLMPAVGKAGKSVARMAGSEINAAMMGERGGLLGAMTPQPKQIFIGAESPMYNRDAAFKASQMLKKGVPPQEVWGETGTAKFGNDFVQEISDANAKFNTAKQIATDAEKIRQRNIELKNTIKESQSTYPDLFPKELTAARRPLREEIKANQNMLERNYGYESDPAWSGQLAQITYEHPSLYQAYPELKGAVIRQGRTTGSSLLGSYEEPARGGVGLLEITKEGLAKNPLSTSTHEMQHAIQGLEGWERGGTPEEFLRSALKERNSIYEKISNLNDQMSKAVGTPQYEDLMNQRMDLVNELQSKGYDDAGKIGTMAYDQYRKLAGEAQARLAQTRLELNPEDRLKYYPFEQQNPENRFGLDVNPNELIFRGNLLN